MAGDHEAMRRHAAELLANREMYPYDVIPAARASLWLRDAAGMREALGERDVSVGRATDLRFAAIRAGLAALEGRTDDARAGYLAAEAGLRELGIRFELGLALLEHAVFLAGDASAGAAADEARAIFEELGATTLLARLPAEVGPRHAATPATPATPAVASPAGRGLNRPPPPGRMVRRSAPGARRRSPRAASSTPIESRCPWPHQTGIRGDRPFVPPNPPRSAHRADPAAVAHRAEPAAVGPPCRTRRGRPLGSDISGR